MRGKSDLFTLVFAVVLAGIAMRASGSPYNLGTVIWLGNAVMSLSFLALEKGWKKLSLGMYVVDLLACLLNTLSLSGWTRTAILTWCLLGPVFLFGYFPKKEKRAFQM